MADIDGTDEDDLLVGKPGESNRILGFAGHDTLFGAEVADVLDGGDGDDLLQSGGGVGNVLRGGSGSDTLIGVSETDQGAETYSALDGGAGDDSIVGGMFDTITGGDGADTIEGDRGSMHVLAGDGDDVIAVELYRCTLDGGDGVDVLRAGGLLSDAASISNFEVLEVRGEVSALASELEQFSVIRSAVPGSRIMLSTSGDLDLYDQIGDAPVFVFADTEDERISVGDGDDSVLGFGGSDRIDGRGGDDTLKGGDDSTLIGGSGDDVLSGGSSRSAKNVFFGGDGADEILQLGRRFQADGGAGGDTVRLEFLDKSGTIDGGDGFDQLIASASISKVTFRSVEGLVAETLISGTAEQFEAFDAISSISPNPYIELQLAVAGSADLSSQLGDRRASLHGSSGDDIFFAGGGDDRIQGGEGDDVSHGGRGADRFIVDAGFDAIYGDGGDDVIELAPQAAGIFDGGAGVDRLFAASTRAQPETDLSESSLTSIEILETRYGVVRGTADQFESFDAIVAGKMRPDAPARLELSEAGVIDLSDELGRRSAEVTGSEDHDVIRLGGGDDIINGGGGADTMRGGGGKDVFLFADVVAGKGDRILDFDSENDRIFLERDLFYPLRKGALAASAFKDVATGTVDANDRMIYDSSSGRLYFDGDGRGGSEATLIATLVGAPKIGAEDFLVV